MPTPLATVEVELKSLELTSGPIHQGEVQILIGDMDGSGKIDTDDINPFVLALTDPKTYDDINPFVALITGGQSIPEPAGRLLLALGSCLTLQRRRR